MGVLGPGGRDVLVFAWAKSVAAVCVAGPRPVRLLRSMKQPRSSGGPAFRAAIGDLPDGDA